MGIGLADRALGPNAFEGIWAQRLSGVSPDDGLSTCAGTIRYDSAVQSGPFFDLHGQEGHAC